MKEELYKKYRDNSKGLEAEFESMGYKKLGWQVYSDNCEDIKKCHEAGHYGTLDKSQATEWSSGKIINRKVFDMQHNQRGSDCSNWCEECKIFWKIDMSD